MVERKNFLLDKYASVGFMIFKKTTKLYCKIKELLFTLYFKVLLIWNQKTISTIFQKLKI